MTKILSVLFIAFALLLPAESNQRQATFTTVEDWTQYAVKSGTEEMKRLTREHVMKSGDTFQRDSNDYMTTMASLEAQRVSSLISQEKEKIISQALEQANLEAWKRTILEADGASPDPESTLSRALKSLNDLFYRACNADSEARLEVVKYLASMIGKEHLNDVSSFGDCFLIWKGHISKPLRGAIQYGSVEDVKALVEAGANPTEHIHSTFLSANLGGGRFYTHFNAVEYAIELTRFEILRYLITRVPVSTDHVQFELRRVLNSKASLDEGTVADFLAKRCDNKDSSLLKWAVFENSPMVTEFLLKNGWSLEKDDLTQEFLNEIVTGSRDFQPDQAVEMLQLLAAYSAENKLLVEHFVTENTRINAQQRKRLGIGDHRRFEIAEKSVDSWQNLVNKLYAYLGSKLNIFSYWQHLVDKLQSCLAFEIFPPRCHRT